MRIYPTIVFLGSSLILTNANAGFQAQDPRSLGMGGTGVAAANSAQAHFYNPSLLTNANEDEDFNFEIPVTARVADPDSLIDSINDFSKAKYIFNFTNALTEINQKINNNTLTPAELPGLRANLVNTATALQGGINNLSNRAVVASGNAGLLVSSPNGNPGWAVYFNYWGDIGAELNIDPRDDQEMTTFINFAEGLLDPGSINTAVPDPVQNLFSSMSADILEVREFGVSLAMPSQVSGYNFDVGVTPKYMSVRTYAFKRSLEQSEQDSEVFDFTNAKEYNSFNLDLGISKKLNENWRSGLVIKNLIPQGFETTTGHELKISPAMRIGTSYYNDWATITADFDLTKNKAPASSAESRYLAIGTELDVWLLKLRLGYRANLATENNNIASIGLGLYLFGLNIDAAIAGGEGESGPNDINAAVQIGLQW